MPTETLTVNVDTHNPGLWVPVGAGSITAALADSNDGTYVNQPNAEMDAGFRVGFTEFTIPDNAQVRSVQMKVRAYHASVSGVRIMVTWGTTGTITEWQDHFVLSTGVQEFTGGARDNPNNGRPWGQVEIDLLTAAVFCHFETMENSAGTRITRLWALAVVNLAPSVTLTGPGNPVTDTSKPTITHTYSDPESDAQERFRYRVFTPAQYNAAGFDPARSLATWDSGVVWSAATSLQVDEYLPNGDYRVYAVVADAGSNGRYSRYGPSRNWTQAAPNPGVPIILLDPEPTPNRVKVSLTEGVGSASTTHFDLQRSDDGGVTWEVVAEMIPNTATIPEVYYDYTAPRDDTIHYRARGVHEDGNIRTVSDWGLSASTVLDFDGSVWLKSTTDSALNMKLCLATSRLESSASEDQVVFEPIGRTYPVVMAGTIRSEAFEDIPFLFENDSQWKAFETLRKRQETLLIQTCYGDTLLEQYFIRLGETRSKANITVAGQNVAQPRLVSVAAREVARP